MTTNGMTNPGLAATSPNATGNQAFQTAPVASPAPQSTKPSPEVATAAIDEAARPTTDRTGINGSTESTATAFRIVELESSSEALDRIRDESTSPAQYIREAFRHIANSRSTICFAMRGRLGPETLSDFAAVPKVAGEAKDRLREDVEKNLLACHGECKTFLAGPINLNGKPIFLVSIGFGLTEGLDLSGTVVFGVVAHNRPALDLARAELQADVQFLLDKLPKPQPVVSSTIDAADEHRSRADDELDMASRTSRYGSTREFAFALVNSIARRFQCHQVAFGLRTGATVSLQAVSGKDKFKASSPGIVDIQQAMEETLDVGVAVSYQTHGVTAAHNPMPVHQQWAETSRSAVCSFPLLVDDDCVAVVSLQRDPNIGFSEAELAELESTLAPFGPAVELSVRGSRSLRDHVKESAQHAWAQVREPSTKQAD